MKFLGCILFFISVGASAEPLSQSELDKAIGTLKKQAYYPISDAEIYEAALKGVLQAVEKKANPKLSHFGFPKPKANSLMKPRQSKEMKNELKGEVTGIGVSVRFDKEKGQAYPVIDKIIEGSGADKAGVKPGDQLLKVSGQPANQFESFPDLVYAIRGPAGSKVKVQVLRNGEVLTKTVKRTSLSFAPFHHVKDYDKAVLVEVGFFNDKATQALIPFIELAKKRKKPLILDLRKSPGGVFKSGVDAIRLFAKKGEKILVTNRKSGKKQIEKALKDGPGAKLKTLVLISPETKSISEAFAGTLRQLRGSLLIGATTYGKATVESLVELEKGYSMKFTVGEMSLPGQTSWNGRGIEPDIPISKEENSKQDLALQVAEKVLKI